jgi:hypothetical protein
MTLYRSRFMGLDLSVQSENVDTNLVFGLFAESNIIFGLSSIISQYLDKGNYYFLSPIFDALTDLVPRFLMPDREHGLYLQEMTWGFISDEGINSKTAYPFIGEFAIMGGWLGISFGIVIYSYLYIFLYRLMAKWSSNKRMFFVGVGLIAAQMGYYHYSRGYLPQMLKSYIFIVLPYIYLCRAQFRSTMLFSGKHSARKAYTKFP